MRRVVLLAAIAITVPSAVRAQACRGSVSFASAPVRFGGGAVFGKDYTGYGAALVGAPGPGSPEPVAPPGPWVPGLA